MPETGDIVTGAGVVGTAFAAFLAALGWRAKTGKAPEKGGELEIRIQQLENRQSGIERRASRLENAVITLIEQSNRASEDRREAHEVRGQIFAEIRQTREAVARIEGRLQ